MVQEESCTSFEHDDCHHGIRMSSEVDTGGNIPPSTVSSKCHREEIDSFPLTFTRRKRLRVRETELDDLHDDLLGLILTFLPRSKLYSPKQVCKRWWTLMTSPEWTQQRRKALEVPNWSTLEKISQAMVDSNDFTRVGATETKGSRGSQLVDP